MEAGAPDTPAAAAPGGMLGLLAQPLDGPLVRELLRTVIDPELGVNIVDLGLVYGVEIDAAGAVAIEMTLTSPGCPLGEYMEDQIHACLMTLPQVSDVQVKIVWEPPWEPEAMSDAAKADLGWL